MAVAVNNVMLIAPFVMVVGMQHVKDAIVDISEMLLQTQRFFQVIQVLLVCQTAVLISMDGTTFLQAILAL